MSVVKEGFLAGLALPPAYTVSEWSDRHIYLPSETSAEPGRWRTDRASYQRDMMDVQTDPTVDTVVYHTSAQVGKTQVILNGIGYHIHHAPAPMLMIEPTLEMAEAFSTDKLMPTIRASAVLAERVGGGKEKSRDASNTMRHKSFPGGSLSIAGANSPTSLRMRSVKIVWADEVDAYPPSAGDEGDPLKLAVKRSQTFWDSKLVCASTPTLAGLSRIDELFEKSDKRYFFVRCAECDHEQHLVWEQVTWTRKQPETAGYCCPHCGCVWNDAEVKAAVRKGRWIATAPFTGTAGFHIWQIYSPWSSLEEIVRGFEETENRPAERQVWWNTTLGRVWDGSISANITVDALLKRREPYPATRLPERVVVLTAGVDVQGDRIEVLFKGYGPDNEQWILDHLKVYGDPASDPPWAELAEVLQVRIPHPSGRALAIEAVAIDSGFMTQKVYNFSSRHIAVGRRWYAIKGIAGEGKVAWAQSELKLKGGQRLYNVGVDGLKTELYSRLATEEHGPNYLHFPEREPFGEQWFEQLIIEKVRTVYDARGFGRREWFKPNGARNEALDLNVYADAAHKSLNINHKERLARMYARADASETAAAVARMFTG